MLSKATLVSLLSSSCVWWCQLSWSKATLCFANGYVWEAIDDTIGFLSTHTFCAGLVWAVRCIEERGSDKGRVSFHSFDTMLKWKRKHGLKPCTSVFGVYGNDVGIVATGLCNLSKESDAKIELWWQSTRLSWAKTWPLRASCWSPCCQCVKQDHRD